MIETKELIQHLRQLGKYSELEPNYLLLAADRIKELNKRTETALPCKVGDVVYTNYNHLLKKKTDEIFECKVVFIGFYKDGNYINLIDNYGHLHSMDFVTFSKTVFATKEETEEMVGDSDE